jgi:hypothetical protein
VGLAEPLEDFGDAEPGSAAGGGAATGSPKPGGSSDSGARWAIAGQ